MSFWGLSGALLSVCVWGVALAAPSSSAEPDISRAVEVPPPKGWHPDMPLFAPQPELNGVRGAKPVVKASDRRVAGAQPSGDRLRGASSKAPSGVKRPLAGKGLVAARGLGDGREARKPGRPGVRAVGPEVRVKPGLKTGTKVGTKAGSKAAVKTGGKVVRKDARKSAPPSAKPVTRAPRQATSSSPRQKTSPKKNSRPV